LSKAKRIKSELSQNPTAGLTLKQIQCKIETRNIDKQILKYRNDAPVENRFKLDCLKLPTNNVYELGPKLVSTGEFKADILDSIQDVNLNNPKVFMNIGLWESEL
jgi:hypothetical protein